MPWEWENSEDIITLPVNFCRDLYIFDVDAPRQNLDVLIGRAKNDMLEWQRKDDKDDRYFYIPVTIIDLLPRSSNLFRDVIACLSQMYIMNCPESGVIVTSLRQIAGSIGMAFNGDRAHEIEDILTFARSYTVKYQPLYRIENGKTVQYRDTFGFIDYSRRVVSIDGGVLANPKIAPTKIKLNDLYIEILRNKKLPRAPIPVLALQKANQAPRRLITPTKNLIYSLSALIPKNEVEYSLLKLKEITGYKENRKDRLRKSIENVLDQLYPVIISDYKYCPNGNKYIFKYAGQLRPNTPKKRPRVRPNTPKTETQYATPQA